MEITLIDPVSNKRYAAPSEAAARAWEALGLRRVDDTEGEGEGDFMGLELYEGIPNEQFLEPLARGVDPWWVMMALILVFIAGIVIGGQAK